MTMDKATIKAMFFNFQGRLNRKPFIIRTIILTIIAMLIQAIFVGMAMGMNSTLPVVIMVLLLIPIFIASLSLGIRRLHDLNRTGWFVLVGVVGSLLYYTNIFAFQIIGGLVCLVYIIYLFAIKGTEGPNQYGVDLLP